MRRGNHIVIAVLALGALSACGGEIGMLPSEQAAYGFAASVDATPDKVLPGQRVNFAVQMQSQSSRPVDVDLTLRLVDEKSQKVIYTQLWQGVHFDLGEVWNLTETFFSATDTERVPHRVELEARAVDTGEVVWVNRAVTVVEFGN